MSQKNQNGVTFIDPQQSATSTTPAISLTDAAIAHIRTCLQKRGSGIGIRLGTKDSGCSGLSYVLDLVDAGDKDDYRYSITEDITVFIDKKAYIHLNGTVIDYTQEGVNYKLTFINPNQKSVCGCGESFQV